MATVAELRVIWTALAWAISEGKSDCVHAARAAQFATLTLQRRGEVALHWREAQFFPCLSPACAAILAAPVDAPAHTPRQPCPKPHPEQDDVVDDFQQSAALMVGATVKSGAKADFTTMIDSGASSEHARGKR